MRFVKWEKSMFVFLQLIEVVVVYIMVNQFLKPDIDYYYPQSSTVVHIVAPLGIACPNQNIESTHVG